MVNVNLLLSRQRKNAGNPSAPSSDWQPSQAIEKDSHSPSRPKVTSAYGETVGEGTQASSKEPAPHAKRFKTGNSVVRHELGKHICPHLLAIDPSHDLWHHPELGSKVLRHAIREADMAYLRPQSSVELVDSAYSDLAKMPAVLNTLLARASGNEEMRIKADELEERCCNLIRECSQLRLDRESMRKQLGEELASAREELKAERASGRGFLDSLGGQRFLKSYKEAALSEYKESMEFQSHRDSIISEFKGSDDFEHFLEEASIPVFDECLAFFRERLVNSGRFPGEKFEFLDPDWVETINVPPTGNSDVARAS